MKVIEMPQTELAGRQIYAALRGRSGGKKVRGSEKACQDYFLSVKETIYDRFVETVLYQIEYRELPAIQQIYIREHLEEFYFFLYDHVKTDLFDERFDAELDEINCGLNIHNARDLIKRQCAGEISSDAVQMIAVYSAVSRSEFDRFSFWEKSELQQNTCDMVLSRLVFLTKFSGFFEIFRQFCPVDKKQRKLFN
jgi:hypothetical protein